MTSPRTTSNAPAVGGAPSPAVVIPDLSSAPPPPSLASTVGTPESVPALCAALSDPEKRTRMTAAVAIGKLKAPESVPVLLVALNDREWVVRQAAVYALGEIGSTQALPAFTAALTDPDSEVRYAAAWALDKAKAPEAVPALVASAGADTNLDVRRAAAEALGGIRYSGFAIAIPRVREPVAPPVCNPTAVLSRLHELRQLAQECFAVLTLNGKNAVIDRHIVSIGTANQSIAMPRDVFHRAIVDGATSIILAHNHPGGDPKPSAADLEITRKFVAAGSLLGITVLDHLIVTQCAYTSIREAGLCDFTAE